ncbi:TPA: hypothetical protein SML65_004709 [Serratia marcescens]|nr:hypothetical protein [Serratia marcescens]
MTLTTEQLSQIKADISARKAMPEYGESVEGNIERLRVIGATRSHFSTETVEMLVLALEEKSRALADTERERDDWVEHSRRMEYRAIEAKELLANREAQPVAWEMRYWNSGYNMWGEWERITAEQHAEMSVQHATDNDYEFRVLYDAPPAPKSNAADWGINMQTGTPILVYKTCSVIESEQAHYVLSLINSAAPPAPAVNASPDFEAWFNSPEAGLRVVNFHIQHELQLKAWEACRAAMLAQPESGGYTLPDNVREALTLALQAMEFMGDTLNNIDAVCTEDVEFVTPAFTAVRGLLAAAPEGGNG